MPDLAVIMSIYHADKLQFVKESVESILNQTFRNFEYYIVFDGPVSEDIDFYITALKDPRVKLHRLKANKGLAFALNYLLEIVVKRPEIRFIGRMDADDISMPERFKQQRDFLLVNNEVSCIGSWYEEIDENGKHLSFRKLPEDHESLRKRYITRTPFAHSSVMYRRELIEQAGFYPEDTILMEDNVLWGRALAAGLKFANLPDYMFKFRKDKGFYKRRSGINYGLNYIKTKSKINRLLSLPFYSYLLTFSLGIFRMLPAFLYRSVYRIIVK